MPYERHRSDSDNAEEPAQARYDSSASLTRSSTSSLPCTRAGSFDPKHAVDPLVVLEGLVSGHVNEQFTGFVGVDLFLPGDAALVFTEAVGELADEPLAL